MDMNQTMNMTPHSEPDMDDADMFCSQCGYTLDGDENYCPECGAPVNDNDADDMSMGHREAVLSYQARKNFPASAFLLPSKRMFPVRNSAGELDKAHIKNALSRIPQSNLSDNIKAELIAKARRLAKKVGIEVSNDSKKESVAKDNNQVESIADGNANAKVMREGTYQPSQAKQSTTESANIIGETMQSQLLVENEQSKVTIVEGSSDNLHRAKFLVTTVDVSNQNGRTYGRALAEKESRMRFEGQILGQSTHPAGTPDPLDNFLVFEKAMLEGDHEFFQAKIANTSKGRDFIELAKAGAMFSVSRRGVGDLKEGVDKNGKKTKWIVPESYVLQGIDVLYPHTASDRAGRMIHFESIQPESNTEGVTKMPESETVVTEEVVSETQAPVTTPEPPVASQSETQSTSSAQAVTTVESGSVTASTPQNAPVPAEIIESLTTQIQAHETQITEQNVKIVNLAKDNATKTEQVKVMTEAISALNNETVRLNKLISEQNTAVNERMKMITDRDALLVKRNQTLAERQKLLVQAHETIAERDNAIGERNRTIAQKNSLVALRDETVSKLQKELSERNTVIAKQDLEIQGRDATIAERDQQIAKERESLAERDAIIAHSDKELVERNAELLTVQQELLNEKVNVELEKNRNAAFQHLFEKVQIEGEKASWFIFNDLRNCATVAEVDEKFAASKVKGIQLIEGVAQVAGRAVLLGTTPTDADEPEVVNPKKPENKSRPALEDDLAKKANSVARYAGL